jgi:hypothetical protein
LAGWPRAWCRSQTCLKGRRKARKLSVEVEGATNLQVLPGFHNLFNLLAAGVFQALLQPQWPGGRGDGTRVSECVWAPQPRHAAEWMRPCLGRKDDDGWFRCRGGFLPHTIEVRNGAADAAKHQCVQGRGLLLVGVPLRVVVMGSSLDPLPGAEFMETDGRRQPERRSGV